MRELEPTEHQLRLGSHVSAAVESYAKRHSAALVLFFAESHVEVGSATCVRIGGRFLLATAAHNIAELDSENVRIVAPMSTSDAWLPIASRSWRLEGLLDVGWLEVTEAVASISGLSFIDAEMLAPFEVPSSESLYLVQGMPAELSSASGKTISLTSLGYMTIPVEPGSTEPDLEMVLDYSGSESPLPIPKGMSGGGIWSIQNDLDRPVWAPENSRLVGITRSWLPQSKHLFAVKIEHWLRLVHEDFPDLRSTIDAILRQGAPNPGPQPDGTAGAAPRG